MAADVGQALKVFYCYAREDSALRDELAKHLRPLRREGLITEWHDRDIEAGTHWEQEIEQQLNTAGIILLLISPDFINSDYAYGIEMEKAIKLHQADQARVIPIILRPSDWEHTPVATIQVLPAEGKPITRWEDRDEAFLSVLRGVRRTIQDFQALRQAREQEERERERIAKAREAREQWGRERLAREQAEKTETDRLMGEKSEFKRPMEVKSFAAEADLSSQQAEQAQLIDVNSVFVPPRRVAAQKPLTAHKRLSTAILWTLIGLGIVAIAFMVYSGLTVQRITAPSWYYVVSIGFIAWVADMMAFRGLLAINYSESGKSLVEELVEFRDELGCFGIALLIICTVACFVGAYFSLLWVPWNDFFLKAGITLGVVFVLTIILFFVFAWLDNVRF